MRRTTNVEKGKKGFQATPVKATKPVSPADLPKTHILELTVEARREILSEAYARYRLQIEKEKETPQIDPTTLFDQKIEEDHSGAPKLSKMTAYGRLYRHPEAPYEELGDTDAAIEKGYLMPSVTNVIAGLDAAHLRKWYAKRAAEDAVKVVQEFPGLIETQPEKAVRWLSKAADRTSNDSAVLGSKVHAAMEAIAKGEDPGPLDPTAEKYVQGWRNFVTDFKPKFLHLETTCFGEVEDENGKLAYAGTADFIAEINGKVYAGDYKTGKSLHDAAAQQLSAIAHAKHYADADGKMHKMPKIDGGIVVHIQPNEYSVVPAKLDGTAWETFCHLRRLWHYRAKASTSREELLLSEKVFSPLDL